MEKERFFVPIETKKKIDWDHRNLLALSMCFLFGKHTQKNDGIGVAARRGIVNTAVLKSNCLGFAGAHYLAVCAPLGVLVMQCERMCVFSSESIC